MKAAIIVTMLNEAETIEALLTGLATQTRSADEIILVDGGSTDRTLTLAGSYIHRLPQMRVLAAPGSNISQGRNHGIAATDCPLIAVTDAGCWPDHEWLAQIVTPLEEDPAADMVSGMVQSEPANHFEACVGVCSLAFRLKVGDKTFSPTARSLAFRRKLWARLGGFPEKGTDIGEDAIFISAAVSADAGLRVAPQAVVHWRPRRSYRAVLRQFYLYADGVARAGLSRRFHTRTIAQSAGGVGCLAWGLLSGHWLPWVLLALLAGTYLARKATQGCFAPPGWRTLYRVPLVLLIIHAGTMAGVITGNWRRLRAR
jgi:succinoglycan biosynthesis protein ExoA